MGIAYNNATATGAALAAGTRSTSFTSRARVQFNIAGESDSGLAYGGSFRADNAAGAAVGTAGSFFISGAGMRLTMGDTNGAAENAVRDLAGVGLTGLGDLNETTFLGNNANQRPTARFDYTIDSLTLSLSVSNPGVTNRVLSVGARYTMDGLTFGLGVEQATLTAGTNAAATVCVDAAGAAQPPIAAGTACPAGQRTVVAGTRVAAATGKQTHVVASVGYTMNGITGTLVYGRLTTAAVTAAQNTPGTGVAIASTSANQYGLSVSATFDATNVTAFGRRDFAGNRHIGIGAQYDLGGGAFIEGGIVNTNFSAAAARNRTQADLGVRFQF
jgi:outer membrane protein OmpU